MFNADRYHTMLIEHVAMSDINGSLGIIISSAYARITQRNKLKFKKFKGHGNEK